eukprot:TRINITY_DN4595_c0_g2_i1.p1 TRINITY_DN4595_c0_g2~~TRINITY_DN4595_c0_g2_i1.p1  ORF type:complete len:1521 (+),score=392.54 TRINITY_DN4595_c0_g2_i1:142-4704(+)
MAPKLVSTRHRLTTKTPPVLRRQRPRWKSGVLLCPVEEDDLEETRSSGALGSYSYGGSSGSGRRSGGAAAGSNSSNGSGSTAELRPAANPRILQSAEELLGLQQAAMKKQQGRKGKRSFMSLAEFKKLSKKVLEQKVALQEAPEVPRSIGALTLTVPQQQQKLKAMKSIFAGGKHLMLKQAFIPGNKTERRLGYFGSRRGRMTPTTMVDHATSAGKMLPSSSGGQAFREQVEVFKADGIKVELRAAKAAMTAVQKQGQADFGLRHYLCLAAQDSLTSLENFKWSKDRCAHTQDKARREAETRSNAKKYQKAATALSSAILWSEAVKVSSALLDKYKGVHSSGGPVLTKAATKHGRREVICGVLPETACEREIASCLLLPGSKLSGGKALPQKLFSEDWTEIDSKTLGKIGSFSLPSDIGICQEALAASRPTGKEVSVAWVKGMSLDPFSDLGGKRVFCLQCKTYVTTNTYELRRHNIQCAGSDKGFLRNFVDETGQLMGMQLEYEHDLAKSTVALRLKAPILAIVRHALWASYWPAESVQASWRVVSLPGAQGLRVLAEDPPPPEVKPGRQGARGSVASQRRLAARSRSARRRGDVGRGGGARWRMASSGSGGRQDSCSSDDDEEEAKNAAKEPELPSVVAEGQGPLFTMMDSLDVPKAPQPRGFVLPLKSEQLHTLGWMHRREGRSYPGSAQQEGGFSCTEIAQRRFGSTDLVLQVRIQRHYEHARGGILGDVVGYGKTACMIGLIAETADNKLQASLSPKEQELCSKLVFTSATLIITPPNLFGQWRDEFTKFLGEGNQLRLVEVVDFTALKRLRVQDIVAADVVLISFRFFFSEAYQRSVDDQVNPKLKLENSKFKEQQKEQKEKKAQAKKAGTSGATSSQPQMPPQYPAAFGYGGFFGDPFGGHVYRPFHPPRRHVVTRFTKEYKQLKQQPDYLASRVVKAHRLAEQQLGHLGPEDLMQQATILEQFYWHRVVFDEFHEVLKLRKGIPYYSLRQLNARYSWGLTATPPLDSAQGVSDMASLLHVHVQSSVDAGKAFLDEWVRSNSWDVASVALEEHWHSVNHTRIERALYLNQKHQLDQQRRTGEGGAVFRLEQRLLMLCSHFSPEGPDEAKNAKAAAKNTQRQQQESLAATIARIKFLEAEKAKLVAKQALLERLAGLCPMPQRQILVAHMPVVELELLATKLESVDEDKREKLVQETFTTGDLGKLWADKEHAGRVPRPGMCTLCDEVPALLHLITEKSKLIGRNKSKQQDNEASMRYFESALKALEDDKDNKDHECSVCLDSIPSEQMAITRCGHVFHEACIHELIPVQKACPHCRQPLSMNCVTRVQDALMASEADPQATCVGSDPDVQRFGSKFAAVLACIRDIRKTEPEAKVILFLQWEQLAHEVERALTAAKLAPLTLRGATRQREKLIGSFTSSEEFKCLVLSLEQSPSGMNLTVANHIILVHPMHAENHAAAVACERQAIGRIRRQGQTKTCHVHRFFTNRTIEEDLVKKNHAEGAKSQRRGNKNAK